jgi:regulator of sigma E protease
MVGAEIPNLRVPAVVGSVVDGSTAAAAGVAPGDRIVAVNGDPVTTWGEVGIELTTSADRPVALTLERGEERLGVTVVPQMVPGESIGDLAGLVPHLLPTVTTVEGGSPAEAAGLRAGDQLRRVDGKPVLSMEEFIAYVSARAGQEVVLEVMRGSRLVEVPVVPRDVGGAGRIGVILGGSFQRYGFFDAFVQSTKYNWMVVGATFDVIGKIFSREVSAKSALAGPIEIAAYSGAAARVGFKQLLYLMGFISISIAIVNLLPIPILDGGQIVILGVESVMRRDLSMRLKEVIAQVGFVLIMLLMLTVIYFDLSKNLPAGLLPGS